MTKITLSFLNRLKPSAKDQFFRDSGLQGFGVKLTPKGRIAFFAEARIRGGQTRRKTLGQHPATSIQDAKDKALEFLRQAQAGVDPVVMERKATAKKQALSKTVEDVFQDYLGARSLKARTLRDYRSTFGLVFSSWRSKAIREVTRKDAEDLFTETSKNRGMTTASKATRIMSAVFNFAMADEVDGERLLTENPFDVIKQKKLLRTPKARDHYLSSHDIGRLVTFFENEMDWGARQVKGVKPQGINYVMLLMATGLRRSEATGLRWENVDWEAKTFFVKDTKNGTDHHVPMSTLVEWILRKQQKAAGGSQWVFPANSASGHMEEPKSQIAKITKATGVKFTSHDLRRTFATHAMSNGANYEMIRQALNHKSGGGITSQYIIRQVDTLRPVFEAVADGYHAAYNPDWKTDLAAEQAEGAYYARLAREREAPTEDDDPFTRDDRPEAQKVR